MWEWLSGVRRHRRASALADVDRAVPKRNASPIVHPILALILLIAATVPGVYKPFGMTPYGTRNPHRSDTWRLQLQQSSLAAQRGGTYLFGIIAIGILLLFVLLHFLDGR